MNQSKGTALITLAAARAVSAERALNTAIVSADLTRDHDDRLVLVDHQTSGLAPVASDSFSADTPDSRTSIARPARFGGSFHGSHAFGTARPRARRHGRDRRHPHLLRRRPALP